MLHKPYILTLLAYIMVFFMWACSCGDELKNIALKKDTIVNNTKVSIIASTFNYCTSHGNHYIGVAYRETGFFIALKVGGRESFIVEQKETIDLPDKLQLDSILKSEIIIKISSDKKHLAYWRKDNTDTTLHANYFHVYHFLEKGPGFNIDNYPARLWSFGKYDTIFKVNDKKPINWQRLSAPDQIALEMLDESLHHSYDSDFENINLWKAIAALPEGSFFDDILLDKWSRGNQICDDLVKKRLHPKSGVSATWRKEVYERIDRSLTYSPDYSSADLDAIEAAFITQEPFLRKKAIAAVSNYLMKKEKEQGSLKYELAYINVLSKYCSCNELNQFSPELEEIQEIRNSKCKG